ncbi:glycosyltransferase [Agromyces cerinus]|uniref:Glycosyltransferase, GT2 family n=1 Tax=Agromyces cerinus subsp. cerinus TaxID=232089 RepID=A0A1N6DIL1_9MICO|nr:glycosyltransferase [Agromyces cerinus]SIN70610.1 Glycosyltransferase, GT2 family [Agromyces cerinus subsp. cerinus]
MAEPRTGDLNLSHYSRKLTDVGGTLVRLEAAPSATVVIPVFNGGEVVRACVAAVRAHSYGRRVVVIDDGSTDPLTLDILAEAEHNGVEVVRNQENIGYTRTANRGFDLTGDDDLILLNSDTIVGPLWIERLRWVAYSRNSVASVSGVSDNAGAFAMPVAGQLNDWPLASEPEACARFVAQNVQTFSVTAPTGHGFCWYLRRDAIEAVGRLDEHAFPRGYGEENDWSMRAVAGGMEHLLAPQVFVQHAQAVSFGSSRQALMAEARETLGVLHPSYRRLVREWLDSGPMLKLRDEFETVRANSSESRALPRTLYVIHQSGGGTPQTNQDLMDALDDEQEGFLLVARDNYVRLERRTAGTAVLLEEWRPAERFSIRDTWRPDYAEVLASWIMKYAIELIHVRHLIGQPLLTLPRVAKTLGVPFILSTHDFYYVCPSIHLLDENLKFCGGVCTPGAGQCRLPNRFTRGAPNLKHEWIGEWRDRADELFGASRHIVATTTSAAGIYAENFPDHASKLILIEHGRDLSTNWDTVRSGRERRPGPLRIACPARWDVHKGIDYLRSLVELTSPDVEWHILGERAEQIGGQNVVLHGEYNRDSLRPLVDEIDPDFIGLFSIWPETYSHTLTEAWALGIPVLATDIGAVADRIRAHGGGHLVPVDSPAAAAEYLLQQNLIDEAAVLRNSARTSIRTREAMAQDYARVYRETRIPRSYPELLVTQ